MFKDADELEGDEIAVDAGEEDLEAGRDGGNRSESSCLYREGFSSSAFGRAGDDEEPKQVLSFIFLRHLAPLKGKRNLCRFSILKFLKSTHFMLFTKPCVVHSKVGNELAKQIVFSFKERYSFAINSSVSKFTPLTTWYFVSVSFGVAIIANSDDMHMDFL